MRLRTAIAESNGRFSCSAAMRDELSHALTEALFELDVLPTDDDAAVIGIYAVMDDLTAAITRTQKLDRALARSA